MNGQMLIIGVSGKMHHGKDTIGDYLVRRYDFQRIGFGDKLKEIAVTYDNRSSSLRRKSNLLIAKDLFEDENKYDQVDQLMQSICPGVWRKLTQDECYVSKSEYARKVMQLLGEGARQIWSECWINYVLKQCYVRGGRFVITDLRYRNEAFAIEMQPNAQLWRVQRDIAPKFGSEHISEIELDDYPFEVYVDNNSTIEDLHDAIDRIIKPLLHGDRPFAKGGEVY